MESANGLVGHVTAILAIFLRPIMDLVAALIQGIRRLLLGLLGGVPAERRPQPMTVVQWTVPGNPPIPAPAKTAEHAASASASLDGATTASAPARGPRWTDRVVRDCLQRVGDGERPFPHQLRKLPLDVAAWVSGMEPSIAADLARSHGPRLRAEFEAWRSPSSRVAEAHKVAPMPQAEREAPGEAPRL